ncbi:MAG: general secretion pathway protein GspM, partial [Desulfobacteraceae bacterium]|nr:general secretion pathway protein GspM [Desulfobacteraceae bacterium]
MLNLSKRDKNVLMVGAVFLAVFILVQFFYFPAIDARQDLINTKKIKMERLDEMEKLRQQYRAVSVDIQGQKEAILKRNKSFSLFLFLDTEAKKCGVKDNVDYMKPFTRDIEDSKYKVARVKVKLSQVYLKELVDFLYLVESSGNHV